MVLFREGEFTNSHWRLHYWSSETSSLHIIIIWFDRGHSDGSHFIKIAILTKCSPFPTKSTSTSLPEVNSGSLGWGTLQGSWSGWQEWSKGTHFEANYCQTWFYTVVGACVCVMFGTSVRTAQRIRETDRRWHSRWTWLWSALSKSVAVVHEC